MGVNSLPKTVSRHCRGCNLSTGPSAPESSTLTTRLPSYLLSWLGARKGIRPVKKLSGWVPGMVICLEQNADLHMAQLMPLSLTVFCFSKIQIGFTFLVPAHPGSPGKKGR